MTVKPDARHPAVATAAVAGLLVATSALALWLRLTGLHGWDGTLSVDEARLALAGRGILEHGVPVLPSGWPYTRGLLASYLVAPSLALLGLTDFAARLPSALAGTALVPVMYALGRSLAGRPAGLFGALFVAGYPPLVAWSREAWLFALYVTVYATALLFILLAHQSGRARDQLLAGALVGLTLFAQELGIFLLVPLGAQVVRRLWCRRADKRAWLAPLAALGLALGAAAVLWVLVTRLRADTLAGPYGEVGDYFSPHLDGAPLRFYLAMLANGRGLVLAAALAGLPFALAWRQGEALMLWLALLPPLAHAVTIIPGGPQERYGLTLMVALLGLAALGVGSLAKWATRRLTHPFAPPALLAWLVFALVLVVHQDLVRPLERGALSSRQGAWLREFRALNPGPEDLVMSDLPTVTGWYLGQLDFWVSSRQYQKYSLRTDDLRRDVHTGAVLIRSVSEFQRLVALPNRGRTLWVVASNRDFQWGELVDDDLKAFLERSASQRISPGDRSRILRIEL